EDFTKRIESLNVLKNNELNKIKELKQRGRISDSELDALYHWTYQPATIAGWQALLEIGRLHNHIIFEIDVLKETLLAQIEQEKVKVAEQEINNLIINTWYKLTTGVFDGRQDE